jgi:hypothetical protein
LSLLTLARLLLTSLGWPRSSLLATAGVVTAALFLFWPAVRFWVGGTPPGAAAAAEEVENTKQTEYNTGLSIENVTIRLPLRGIYVVSVAHCRRLFFIARVLSGGFCRLRGRRGGDLVKP